ncbi:XRE family transcriptional regulator [Hyphococcus luteus]|uniref:XRE family transcriptional regulator n=1 Tax=Hyphococcus luteus TaxID=2058213 RepID=A0A2S7K3R7_9PROT|nr:XRE family transcriptional regulator [Marinicaulis flavus]PQA87137.1 XRE family transcriptional regulator [Marinicaulis flavus]
MPRALKDVIDKLPPARRAKVERRYADLVEEIETLSELRKLTSMSQAKLAETLQISQPAISKLEKQTDMYLSTLRLYVEAMGGELDIVIRLPNHAPIKVRSLGDAMAE